MKKSLTTFGIWAMFTALAVLVGGGEPAYAIDTVSADPLLAIAIGGLTVNAATLAAAQTAFSTIFSNALGAVETYWETVAMRVNSNTSQNDYKWLGGIRGLRKWLGDKQVQNLVAHGYLVKNEDFEDTVGVKRNDIEDDQLGVYNPLFAMMGNAAGSHPDELLWAFLQAGFNTGNNGFDGVSFFSTAHPVNGMNTDDGTYANRPASLGTGEAWFLIDDTKPIKPLIFQVRKDYSFVSQTDPQSDNVFKRAEYNYGVEARVAAGYGLPQLIYGSKATLDAASYKAARSAMMALKGVDGRVLGIRPTTLVVGGANEEAGRILLENMNDASGATNPWRGTAKLKVVPYLT